MRWIVIVVARLASWRWVTTYFTVTRKRRIIFRRIVSARVRSVPVVSMVARMMRRLARRRSRTADEKSMQNSAIQKYYSRFRSIRTFPAVTIWFRRMHEMQSPYSPRPVTQISTFEASTWFSVSLLRSTSAARNLDANFVPHEVALVIFCYTFFGRFFGFEFLQRN